MSIAENIARIHERIYAAERRRRVHRDHVRLMAVTKTVSPEQIGQAYRAGLRLFGENRVQEFAQKADMLRDLAESEWHMIGHLQSNKASQAAALFAAVDSLDSARLGEKLNSAAGKLGRNLRVLVEINMGGETSKSGVAPQSAELEAILEAAPRWRELQLQGLMAIPPFTADPEDARPYFRRLQEISDEIAARHLPGVSMDVLSMGMSHDFEVAIEEGSTCVRLGTAIFGERTQP